MKKPDLLFSVLLVPFDWLALVSAAMMSYYLRFSALANLRPIIFEIPFYQYLFTVMLIALLWLPIFGLAGLYSVSREKEFVKIFFATTVGIMGIILFIFFRQELFSSRFIILAVWLSAIIFVWLERKIFRQIRKIFANRKRILQKIILVGNGEKSDGLIDLIKKSTEYHLIEWIKNPSQIDSQYLKNKKHELDEIIIIDPHLLKEEKLRLLSLADEENIPFRYLADSFDAKATNIGLEMFFGFPLIAIKRTKLEGWGRVIKRIFDTILALIALIIFSPFFLIIPILIKFDSRGSAFVFLERVGRRGKKFKLIKFRSMIEGADDLKKELMPLNERHGPLFKIKNDPRITKLGQFLRKTSIDEIPQFINVLKGKMSLVGPRPHEPVEVEKYEGYQKKLLFIKPGVTGLAQLYGRSNVPFEEEAKLDLYYIENWSFWKDIEIIFRTIPLVLFGRGAT